MKWFERLGVRAKLAIGFLAIGVLVTITLVTAFQQLDRVLQSEEAISKQSTLHAPVTELANLDNLLAAQRAETVALLAVSGAQRQKFEESIRTRALEIDRVITVLEQLTSYTPETQSKLRGKLRELVSIRGAIRQTREQQIIPLIRQGKNEQAKRLLFGIQQQRVDKLRSILRETIGTVQQRQQSGQQLLDARRARESAWRTTIIVAIVTVLLSVIIAEMTIRSVAQQNRA